jgi:hypothetical protein
LRNDDVGITEVVACGPGTSVNIGKLRLKQKNPIPALLSVLYVPESKKPITPLPKNLLSTQKKTLYFYPTMAKKYKIGLVLSGGGARGFAHLGVVKALNEKSIYPDIISGVSAGSIAGIFLADGQNPDDIFKLLKKKRSSIFLLSGCQKPDC